MTQRIQTQQEYEPDIPQQISEIEEELQHLKDLLSLKQKTDNLQKNDLLGKVRTKSIGQALKAHREGQDIDSDTFVVNAQAEKINLMVPTDQLEYFDPGFNENSIPMSSQEYYTENDVKNKGVESEQSYQDRYSSLKGNSRSKSQQYRDRLVNQNNKQDNLGSTSNHQKEPVYEVDFMQKDAQNQAGMPNTRRLQRLMNQHTVSQDVNDNTIMSTMQQEISRDLLAKNSNNGINETSRVAVVTLLRDKFTEHGSSLWVHNSTYGQLQQLKQNMNLIGSTPINQFHNGTVTLRHVTNHLPEQMKSVQLFANCTSFDANAKQERTISSSFYDLTGRSTSMYKRLLPITRLDTIACSLSYQQDDQVAELVTMYNNDLTHGCMFSYSDLYAVGVQHGSDGGLICQSKLGSLVFQCSGCQFAGTPRTYRRASINQAQTTIGFLAFVMFLTAFVVARNLLKGRRNQANQHNTSPRELAPVRIRQSRDSRDDLPTPEYFAAETPGMHSKPHNGPIIVLNCNEDSTPVGRFRRGNYSIGQISCPEDEIDLSNHDENSKLLSSRLGQPVNESVDYSSSLYDFSCHRRGSDTGSTCSSVRYRGSIHRKNSSVTDT